VPLEWKDVRKGVHPFLGRRANQSVLSLILGNKEKDFHSILGGNENKKILLRKELPLGK